MTTIGVTHFGGPEALHEIDGEPEPLGASDVRIQVTAAGVSPSDLAMRQGDPAALRNPNDKNPSSDLPSVVVPGMEAAGVVLEVGADVDTGLRAGDRAMAIVVVSGTHGAYRGNLVVPARSVVRAPEGLSDAQAATLPMNGLTARLLLDTVDLASGSVLAVTGPAGTVGGYVIQLAKADGLTVVADASDEDRETVEKLGADTVVARGDGFVDAVRQQYPDGVDGLIDTAIFEAAVHAVVKDGGEVATSRPVKAIKDERVHVVTSFVASYVHEWEKLDRLRAQAEDGQITPRVADVVPAAQASEAHRRLEAGGVRGRLVLAF